MKKLFALMMVLALSLCSIAALAEAAEAPVELNWSDFEAVTESVEGSFRTFDEVALQMWVPSYFVEKEVSEEEAAQGFIKFLKTPDDAYSIGVMLLDKGMTIEEYAAWVAQVEGVSGVQMMTINGLPCVSYDMDANDLSCISYATQSGKVLEFGFSPISDEGYASLVMCMAASTQPEQ